MFTVVLFTIVNILLLLSHVQLFATPWTAVRQASLTYPVSQSLLKLMSSSRWCHPTSSSYISPSNTHPGLISFRMDWLDLLAVQGTLKSLLQHHSSKLAQIHVHMSMMLSNHLIIYHPLLLLPSLFPSIRVFSNESALCIWWPEYWSFSFSISPSSEHGNNLRVR